MCANGAQFCHTAVPEVPLLSHWREAEASRSPIALDFHGFRHLLSDGKSGRVPGVKETLEEIARSIREIHREVIDPVEDKLAFEKRPSDGEISGGPLVLVVGNHSSGKSTFINHLVGQEIQRTGMAPTDDCFTILRHGENREERDGAAVVSNPDLPFNGLAPFGEGFVSHFRMRLLPLPLLKNVTLVDTPGMIDAADPEAGRGYDFAGVVRWFAERADVILVFFDPDRPGTTAESLTILTQSLSRMDHKLLVVMNKMDQFRSMRDFARCYGTLCWNLGKVIKKKDIPQIYTTYVPVEGAPTSPLPLDDFEHARRELIEEINRAPVRRVDNMITQTANHADRLRMHSRISQRALGNLRGFQRRLFGGFAAAVVAGLAGCGWYIHTGEWGNATVLFLLTIAGGTGLYYLIKYLTQTKERDLINRLDEIFEEVYLRDLTIGNRPENLLHRWEEVKPITKRTLKQLGLHSMARLKTRETARLDRIINQQLPELRARLHRHEESAEEQVPAAEVTPEKASGQAADGK